MNHDDRTGWLEAFDGGREEILQRIRQARKVSDEGVLAAGSKIHEIVSHARRYIEEMEKALQATEDGGLDRLVDEVRSNVVGQHSKVQAALERSTHIRKAGMAIEGAAKASRLLALNARVEASRLTGSHGAAFDVIAEEVRDLSEEIARANHHIEELISDLLQMLPQIANEAESARKLVENLYEKQQLRHQELHSRMTETAQSGTDTLNHVLSEARSALSDLQFQDPMIQDIEGIDRILVKVRNHLASQVGKGEEVEAAYAALLSERTEEVGGGVRAKDAGEALLF